MAPISRQLLIRAAALLCAAASGPAAALPPEQPARAIRMLVGFAPGGGVDVMARPIIQKLAGLPGQQVVIDIRPGAGASSHPGSPRGRSRTATRSPVVVSAFAINAVLHAQARYNETARGKVVRSAGIRAD